MDKWSVTSLPQKTPRRKKPVEFSARCWTPRSHRGSCGWGNSVWGDGLIFNTTNGFQARRCSQPQNKWWRILGGDFFGNWWLFWELQQNWVVATQIFLCSPLSGEDSHFDEHIFQMGWFNHQLGLGDEFFFSHHPQFFLGGSCGVLEMVFTCVLFLWRGEAWFDLRWWFYGMDMIQNHMGYFSDII